ncbi:type IV toxin-antitoxin system AbiEi family antitoxin domain-containing protein [Gimesia sp.]|uniref:type IV toxin-antitoxin system AbiEi family antitoxin domain-containing protein n=1 Tax=Gimesia sp. TaxID=2024833 RepID=UPI003A9222CC
MAKNQTKRKPIQAARKIFYKAGGVLRTREALQAGIHPRTLYALRDSGQIEQLSRGLFRLAEETPLGNPDLVTIAHRIPEGVICLISALAWHELTTQIPHEVYVAIPRGKERPRIDYPPVKHFWFSQLAFESGIETQQVDGVPIRIYCCEKTIADCFKYRNRIGLDTALEALKLYRQQKLIDTGALLRYADICRVKRVMTPYLEAIL